MHTCTKVLCATKNLRMYGLTEYMYMHALYTYNMYSSATRVLCQSTATGLSGTNTRDFGESQFARGGGGAGEAGTSTVQSSTAGARAGEATAGAGAGATRMARTSLRARSTG